MEKGTSRRTLEQRFEARVVRGENCWSWAGSHNNMGYAVIAVKCEDGKWRPRLCHRVSYTLLVGPIPPGLVLDHTCRNTRCVNPEHLEPVTDQTNFLRSSHPSAVGVRRRAAAGGKCAADGCEREIRRRDWCHSHYERWRRTGSPIRVEPSLTDRLAARSAPMSGGCRVWTGAKFATGYGKIKIAGRDLLVHRVAYENSVRPLAAGERVRHRCPVRTCINPDHLQGSFAVT